MSQEVSYDWLVDRYLGSTGRWQVQQVSIVLLCTFASSFPLYIHLFTAFVPPHRCHVPICDGPQTHYNESFVPFAIPEADVSDDFLGVSEAYSQCSMYQTISEADVCVEDSFDVEATESCTHGYVYSTSIFESTLATETDLVCDHASLSQLISSVIPFGVFVGSCIGGPIADRQGRRIPLILGSVLGAIALGVSGIVVDYYVFLICRFLVATAAGITWVANRPMELELFGTRHRSQAMFVDNGLYQLFAQLAALMAWFISDWRHIHYLSAFLSALPALIAIPFLYESPRWLAFNGKEADVSKMVRNVMETNGRTMDKSDEIALLDHLTKLRLKALEASSSASSSNFTSLFGGSLLLRITLTCFMVIVGSVTQYSLTFGSVTSLSGNIFLNFCLTFLVSIPVYPLLFFFSPSRKPTLMLILTLMGLSSCTNAFVDKSSTTLVLILMLLTRLTANAVLNLGAVYTSELFPTVVRAQALGFNSAVSKLLSSAAPFLENLGHIWQPLPLLLIGLSSLLAGLLLLLLPETKDQPLMDTLPSTKQMQEKMARDTKEVEAV